ncbi:MAG: ABC transporter ATP-binding protein [Clostridiales bacterium]|nr:ABC transporter ATP-binding protein [Clostridiales bacterium]
MICVQNLTKIYGNNTAVNNISFEIEEGKVYGFLGPNGAGKSTTMNMITGCLAATQGRVSVDGLDHFDDAKKAKALIGYLPEQPPLYFDLTPLEYLMFVGEAKGLRGEALAGQVKEVMEETQITDVSGRLIKNLSKGYKQRVGIAQAMLGNPKYIILDEPTVGLDPLQIIEIRKLIRSLAKERTVILSSHILAEVQEVCDELIVIIGGKIAAKGTIEDIKKNLSGPSTLTVAAKSEPGVDKSLFAGIDGIDTVQCSTQKGERQNETHFHITVADGADIREAVFKRFCEKGFVLLEMTAYVPSLEDIFIRLTESQTEGAGQEQEIEISLSPAAREAAILLTANEESQEPLKEEKADDEADEALGGDKE